MVLALSRKLSPSSPAQAAEFMKWASHTADARTQRARRSIGKTALGRFMRSSNTTWSGAEYDGSYGAKERKRSLLPRMPRGCGADWINSKGMLFKSCQAGVIPLTVEHA